MASDPAVERGVLTAPRGGVRPGCPPAVAIGHLVGQRTVGLEAADAAAAQLGVSRRQVPVLIRRWRAGEGRFGTFSPLRGIHSAPSPEIYPNTATLTFYKSTYASKYLSFVPVEHQTVDHKPLQSLTKQQERIWSRYEPDQNTRGYPFTDIGNRYMATVLFDPTAMAGKTWSQIASAMQNPSSRIARDVDGAANYFTAAICQVTGNRPVSVCSARFIKNLRSKL